MKILLRAYWSLLFHYLKPQWPWVALLAILLLSSIGLQLVLPQIMRSFIDTTLAGGALTQASRAGYLFIVVALVYQAVAVGAAYLGQRVGWTATNALRTDLAQHCLHLDMSFHNARTPGELIERIDGDVTALTNFFSQFVIQIGGNLLLLMLVNVQFTLSSVGQVLALVVGALLFRAQAVTIGTVYLIFHYSHIVFWGPIMRMMFQVEDLQQAGASIERVRKLFSVQTQIGMPENAAGLRPDRVDGSRARAVSFEDVSFGYPRSPAPSASEAPETDEEMDRHAKEIVLHDLSFSLQPGQVLGLLGRTGSGKTTLARLLFRLYDPDRGVIRLGDGDSPPVDLWQISLADLRRRVGMVTQEVQLFHATVRDNLTFLIRALPTSESWRSFGTLGSGSGTRRCRRDWTQSWRREERGFRPAKRSCWP